MFCPKCGTNLPENSEFCSNCGTNLKEFQSSNELPQTNQELQNEQSISSQTPTFQSNNEGTMTEIISKKSKDFLNPLMDKLKSFVSKYKKQLLIGLGCLITILILVFIYGKLFGFEKLKWNKDYEDYKLEHVTQSKVKLGIKFSDEKKLDQIKIKTTCGKYEINGLEIEWDLTEALGQCKIEVKHKLKKISKNMTVINPFADKQELSLEYKIDYDSDEDLDLDGLTNKQEKEYKTNPELYDTDMDGLDDKYELFTSKTDPLKKDTDGDGLSDYDEIELGLDPLKADSKGDGTKDGNRKVSYTVQNEKLGITLEISGTGNIPSSTIDTFKNSTFKEMDGLLDTVYNFYTSGKIESAKVTIPYSLEEITAQGLNEDNLTLYYFNEKTKELEAMPTTVDKENKVVVVTLKHFSKYVLGDSNVVLTTTNNQIMMVIDNSVSMYTYAQLTALGYTDITGADGNDSSFKRLSLTNNLIDMFTGSYYFGISEFAGNYINLQKFTDDQASAKKAVNSIKNDLDDIGNGTNIVNALNKGISEFSKDDNGHYLILLTDGKDTSTFNTLSSNKSTIISNAKAKDVKICVIGLGSSIDTDDLNSIAEGTGCDYYNASDAGALDEIYSIIGADINYNLVDTDGDGNVDGTIMSDSGFIVTRDGFSFPNYGTNLSSGGHCYGMATIAELYYTKKLPMSASSKTVKQKSGLFSTENTSSYAYNLNNTYFTSFGNLYDYKLKTNVLKNTFGFEAFGEEKPKDYMTLSGKTLVYSKKYKDELTNSAMYDISISKSGLDAAKQLERWGVNYDDAENALLNEDNMQSSSVIDNSDKQLLNAIYTGFIRQNATEHYSSSSNFVLWLRNVFGSESTEKMNSAAFIELLRNRLDSGDVPVISASYSGGLHAINAISLAQDNEDANHYYIGVYDNNYPGEKRYVDVQCNKNTCVTKANSYYTSSDEPIRITASLEYDLEFFK